ncbi:MAG: hypothetical protein HUU47_06200 [Bacteroidetes bacterium]|nr:hypothetical protein [Bacteroidota bacterium]
MEKYKAHKIFFSIAFIGIAILAVLTYLSKNALVSDTNAAENLKNFNYYYNYLSDGNLILFAVLLFVSNILYISGRHWFTFICTGIILLFFNVIDWFWLSEMFFHYKKRNHLWQGETNLAYIVGFFFSILGLLIIVINYYILKLILRNKSKDINKPETSVLTTTEKENEIRTDK